VYRTPRCGRREESSAGGGACGVCGWGRAARRQQQRTCGLPPRPAAAGHGRCLLTRARKQGSPVWRPDRAQNRATATPTPPPDGRGGAALDTPPALVRRFAGLAGTAKVRGTGPVPLCVRACLGSLSGFAVRIRARGDRSAPSAGEDPRPCRPTRRRRRRCRGTSPDRFATRVLPACNAIVQNNPKGSSLSGNKMRARKSSSFNA
jgi:hypothetical protein